MTKQFDTLTAQAAPHPLDLKRKQVQQAGRRPIGVSAIDISHSFGPRPVLESVSLIVPPGSFVSLVGPSGSGKTTLLRIIAGLIEPTSGTVEIGGRDVSRLPADKRDAGFVFQNYALFPHLSVYDNIAFPLKLRGVPADDIRRRTSEALKRIQLTEFARRYPAELSGGQQQRVALARAFVFEPTVLLMDEPLGALDKNLRQQLQRELRDIQRQLGITTIYVTHDQDEAFSMSDQIAIMGDGRVHQLDRPEDLYNNPQSAFVANFVGDFVSFGGRVSECAGGEVRVASDGGTQVTVRSSASFPVGSTVLVGIRPEKLKIKTTPGGADCHTGRIVSRVFKGTHYRLDFTLDSGETLSANASPNISLSEGDIVSVSSDPADWHIFEAVNSHP